MNISSVELPVPTLDSLNEFEDRFIRLLREDQQKSSLFYRYGDLCALDTIQVDLAPEMQGNLFIDRFSFETVSLSSIQVSLFDISFIT